MLSCWQDNEYFAASSILVSTCLRHAELTLSGEVIEFCCSNLSCWISSSDISSWILLKTLSFKILSGYAKVLLICCCFRNFFQFMFQLFKIYEEILLLNNSLYDCEIFTLDFCCYKLDIVFKNWIYVLLLIFWFISIYHFLFRHFSEIILSHIYISCWFSLRYF